MGFLKISVHTTHFKIAEFELELVEISQSNWCCIISFSGTGAVAILTLTVSLYQLIGAMLSIN